MFEHDFSTPETMPHGAVYTEICRRLRFTDDVSPRLWRTLVLHDGQDEEPAPIGSLDQMPALVVFPNVGADRWYGPADFESQLACSFSLLVPGRTFGRAVDFLFAMKRVIYPTDTTTRLEIQAALVAAGATTGDVVWDKPNVVPAELVADGQLAGLFWEINSGFVIDVKQTINP